MSSGTRTVSEAEQGCTPGPRRGRARGWAGVLIAGTMLLTVGILHGTPALGFIDPLILIREVFDSEATASEGGRHLTVTGTFVCPEKAHNSPFQGEASVLQEATGAVFRGVTVGQYPHSTGTFTIAGPVREGSPAFAEGRALARGLAATSRRASINSVTQWCACVSSVPE